MSRAAVVLGARNLGVAVVDGVLAGEVDVVGVARGDDTPHPVTRRVLAVGVDPADPGDAADAPVHGSSPDPGATS